jgi:hypothetical protein
MDSRPNTGFNSKQRNYRLACLRRRIELQRSILIEWQYFTGYISTVLHVVFAVIREEQSAIAPKPTEHCQTPYGLFGSS